jgi:hypothetical protein
MSIFVKVHVSGTDQDMKVEVDIREKIVETLADFAELAFN